jgi:hypothetical protein
MGNCDAGSGFSWEFRFNATMAAVA